MWQQFNVSGMTCGHCARAVTDAVKQIDPAAEVKVDLTEGQVSVRSEQPRATLADAIRAEGYAVAA